MWDDGFKRAQIMTETLSIRLDTETKKRLDALAERSRRIEVFLGRRGDRALSLRRKSGNCERLRQVWLMGTKAV